MQKLQSHLMKTQNLKVLPLKPGVDQYIAIHATLTPCYILPFWSIHLLLFFKTSPEFFLC